jgi:hypothetical protein
MKTNNLSFFSIFTVLFFCFAHINVPTSLGTAGGTVTNMRGISLLNGIRIKIGDKIKNMQEVRMFPEAVLELQDNKQGIHYYQTDKTCTSNACQPSLRVSLDKRGNLKFGTQTDLERLRQRLSVDSTTR